MILSVDDENGLIMNILDEKLLYIETYTPPLPSTTFTKNDKALVLEKESFLYHRWEKIENVKIVSIITSFLNNNNFNTYIDPINRQLECLCSYADKKYEPHRHCYEYLHYYYSTIKDQHSINKLMAYILGKKKNDAS
jgi:hypothetical protein